MPFGPGLRNFPDLPVHGTADEVLADWENSRRPVTAWLTSASDTDPRSITLRATQVYRREGGEWKVAHRHAETVTE